MHGTVVRDKWAGLAVNSASSLRSQAMFSNHTDYHYAFICSIFSYTGSYFFFRNFESACLLVCFSFRDWNCNVVFRKCTFGLRSTSYVIAILTHYKPYESTPICLQLKLKLLRRKYYLNFSLFFYFNPVGKKKKKPNNNAQKTTRILFP